MATLLTRQHAPDLFYQMEGSGPPVMLIHGVGADGRNWDAIAPVLAVRYTVLRLDLRGHGRSGHIVGPLALDDFARDVVDVLDAAGVTRAHVVGFSLGGMIAQALGLDHAARVDRLVLLSAVAGRTEQERTRVRERLNSAHARDRGNHRGGAGPVVHGWVYCGASGVRAQADRGAEGKSSRVICRGVYGVFDERSGRAVGGDCCADLGGDRRVRCGGRIRGWRGSCTR